MSEFSFQFQEITGATNSHTHTPHFPREVRFPSVRSSSCYILDVYSTINGVNTLTTKLRVKMGSSSKMVFEDFFPAMVEKLGGEGFMKELCKGFHLLMDVEKGLITRESLKKKAALLGLDGLSDDEVTCMVKEGDFDGDGGLNQMEFCVLMVRLSPGLMAMSIECLDPQKL